MKPPWLPLLREPAPAQRLAGFRALVGAFAVYYLLRRFPGLTGVASLSLWEFSPVGAAKLLSAPLPGWLVVAAPLLALPFGVAFTLGCFYRVTAPLFALLLLWVTSYRNSFGMLFHTENLLVLHAGLLALSPAADAWSFDARRGRRARASDARYAQALAMACALTVVTYFVAGVAKLKLGGVDWLQGEQLRTQIAYDNLRKVQLGRSASALGVWFVRQPSVFPPLALMTLLIELGAPLALLSRRVALVWALGAWAFHLGVMALMNITFPYPLSWVPYLAFFRIELWPTSPFVQRLRRLKGSIAPSRPHSP